MTVGGPGERPDRKPSGPSSPAPPAEETERLEALHRYRILDAAPEPAFDRVAALAARLFGAPIAASRPRPAVVALVEGRVTAFCFTLTDSAGSRAPDTPPS